MAIRSTQGFQTKLVADDIILDLFQDEEIKISNNITNLFDIGAVPAEFSRTIMLPGTKKNNAFFEHVYDISVTNPFLFSTNTKVSAYLDFDGIYLVSGYLQLNKVTVYENKFIDSYEISLYGIVSSFSRDINKLTLNDLTSLNQFNHTSSYDNITKSWNTGSAANLFSGSIVYPLADYGSGWKFNSAFNYYGIDEAVSPSAGITVQDYKPAIRIKEVWDAVFDTTGYTYSSSFWQQPWLDDVYMICNYGLKYPKYSGVDLETYGVAKISAISGSNMTDLSPVSESVLNLPWYNVEKDPSNVIGNNSSYTLPVSSSLQGVLQLEVNLSASVINGATVELYFTNTGSLAQTYITLPNISNFFYNNAIAGIANGDTGINQTYSVQTEFISPLLAPGTYYFGIKWRPNVYTSKLSFTIDPNGKPKSYIEVNKVRQAADGRVMDIPYNMPYGTTGIKLVDWIKGIQKKFNLVIYPDKGNNNNMIVETFNNWYNTGQIKDFNKYLNLNKPIDVVPANNLAVNKLNFGDTLDTDYISQQFGKAANREYAKSYYVDNQNYFSQGEFEVKTTFASSPLVYLQGTGISGSIGGINPPITQYSAGTWQFTSLGARAACSSTTQIEIFTANGSLTSGQVAYRDQYGTAPLTGYTYFSNGTLIYSIGATTGIIGVVAALCGR